MAKYFISIYKSLLSSEVDESSDLLMSLGRSSASGGSVATDKESDSTTFATYDSDNKWITERCDISLSWLKTYKRMFEPGCVEFELQMTPKADQKIDLIGDKGDILNTFMRHKIDVEFRGDDNSDGESTGRMTLAKSYYITSINPSSARGQIIRRNATSSYYLRVKAHSLDYYMTLNKHSETFLGKGVSELFRKAVERFSYFTETRKNYDAGSMRQLKKWSVSSEEKESKTYDYYKFEREAVVPYIVQYNESTYDFLRRVASRYGEYLYTEDGVLRLGLKFSGANLQDDGRYEVDNAYVVPNITSYLSLEYLCEEEKSPLARQRHVVSSSYTYGLRALSTSQETTDSSNLKGNPDITYADFVSDEPLDPTFFHVTPDSEKDAEKAADKAEEEEKKDAAADSTTEENAPKVERYLNKADSLYSRLTDFSSNQKYWATAVFNALAAPDFLSIIETVGWGAALNYGIAANTRELMNDGYDAWTGFDGETNSYASGVIYNNWDSVRDTDFSFLSIAQIESEKISKQKYTFYMGGYACDGLKLGDIFTFSGQKYIAIEIATDIAVNFDQNLRQSVEPINPLSDIHLKIVAVPYSAEGGVRLFPPMVDCDLIRHAEPQLAYIADNKDPRRMNRVRICYPWQPNYSKGVTEYTSGADPERIEGEYVELADTHRMADLPYASPWIRLSMPYASGGSGFSFIPNNGDEVMVNFEGGNIERPYVDGSFFKKDEKIMKSAMGTTVKSITTRSGQGFYMTDGVQGTNFIAKMSGLLGFVSGFAPGFLGKIGNSNLNSELKELDGNIEFTDKYGIYSVKMSTTDRQVSVSSPLGNVVMNAFTGITLSAPNGNIAITGKNVTISAGNELKLESGTNISTVPKNGLDYATAFFKPLVKQVVGIVCDVSLVRIMYEALFKPMSGTMTIKSNRYMLIGAGKGNATAVSDTAMANRGKKQQERADQPPHDYFTDAVQRLSTFLNSVRSYTPNTLLRSRIAYASLRGRLKPLVATLAEQMAKVDAFVGHDSITTAAKKALITEFETKFDNVGTIRSTTETIGIKFETADIKALRENSEMYDVSLLQRINNLIKAHNALIEEVKRGEELTVEVCNSLYDAAFKGARYSDNVKDVFGGAAMHQNELIRGVYSNRYGLSTQVAYMRASMLKLISSNAVDYFVGFKGFGIKASGVTLGAGALTPANLKTINNNWANFTRSLGEQAAPPGFGGVLKKVVAATAKASFALSAMPYKSFRSVNAAGEILFSNKPNQTLHFDRNNRLSLHPAQSLDNSLGDVARILGGM